MPTGLGDDLGVSVGDLDLNTTFNLTVTRDASGQETVTIAVDPSLTPVAGSSPDTAPSVPDPTATPPDVVTPPAPDGGTAPPVAGDATPPEVVIPPAPDSATVPPITGSVPDTVTIVPDPTVTAPDAVAPQAPDGGSAHSPPLQVDPSLAGADMISALHSYSLLHSDAVFN